MAAPAPAGSAAGNQRAAIIAAGGLVFLLLFFVVIRPALFGGGGGGGTGTPAVPPLARPRATTTTVVPPGGPPSESFEVFNTKNPFTPLVNPSGSGGTGTTPAGGATTGLPAGTTGTVPSAGRGTTATTAPSGASGGAATEPRRSQRVALLNVYQSGGRTVADVRVNDTVFTKLAAGDVFDGNFKVVSLQGSCGSFLFGDERFQLCKGEEVLK
jgi:hypothetical protein